MLPRNKVHHNGGLYDQRFECQCGSRVTEFTLHDQLSCGITFNKFNLLHVAKNSDMLVDSSFNHQLRRPTRAERSLLKCSHVARLISDVSTACTLIWLLWNTPGASSSPDPTMTASCRQTNTYKEPLAPLRWYLITQHNLHDDIIFITCRSSERTRCTAGDHNPSWVVR